MIKILIVDDSALMRRHLSEILSAQNDMEVQTARNGVEALQAIETFDPQVVTLDINMPEMDGITCLSRIMVSKPRPVVMISSITQEGAEATLQALNLGAVDFILKPGGTISLSMDKVHGEVLAKVRAAAGARARRMVSRGQSSADPTRPLAPTSRPHPPQPASTAAAVATQGLILVGVSTGGPGALENLLPHLPGDLSWPVLIAQHMPAAFTAVFARRLNQICALQVVEVDRQMSIDRGTIYIARGDADLVVRQGPLGPRAIPVPASTAHLWHPSVERMVASAHETLPASNLICVQLTGMGHDGATAMAAVKRAGGRTIAQDEATSVVFGMPQELINRDGATTVLPIGRIARQLALWTAPALNQKERSYGAR